MIYTDKNILKKKVNSFNKFLGNREKFLLISAALGLNVYSKEISKRQLFGELLYKPIKMIKFVLLLIEAYLGRL